MALNRQISAYLVCIFFLIGCSSNVEEGTNTDLGVAFFTGTTKNDNFSLSTYSIDWEGRIKEISNSPLWPGEPILGEIILILNPNENTTAQVKHSGAIVELFDMNSKQSTTIELPDSPSHLYGSPIGDIIAYNIFLNGKNTLYFLDPYQAEIKLTKEIPGPELVLFGWLGGNQGVFFSHKDNVSHQNDIFKIDKTTGQISRLTNDSNIEILYEYSSQTDEAIVGIIPSSEELYYESNRSSLYPEAFYVVDLSNGKESFKPSKEILRTASWSKNGEKIAISLDGELCILFTIEQKRECPLSSLLTLDDYRSALIQPAIWSPDNEKLMFQAINQLTFCHEVYIYDSIKNDLNFIIEQPCFPVQFHH